MVNNLIKLLFLFVLIKIVFLVKLNEIHIIEIIFSNLLLLIVLANNKSINLK